MTGALASLLVTTVGDVVSTFCDRFTVGLARRHLHGRPARPAARPPRGLALEAVRGRRGRRRSGASAAPAPDA